MKKGRMFVYATLKNDEYDIDEIFESAEDAIELAINGENVAVFDAFSLEYLGRI